MQVGSLARSHKQHICKCWWWSFLRFSDSNARLKPEALTSLLPVPDIVLNRSICSGQKDTLVVIHGVQQVLYALLIDPVTRVDSVWAYFQRGNGRIEDSLDIGNATRVCYLHPILGAVIDQQGIS